MDRRSVRKARKACVIIDQDMFGGKWLGSFARNDAVFAFGRGDWEEQECGGGGGDGE